MSEKTCDCAKSFLKVPNMKKTVFCENCGKVYKLDYQDPITGNKVWVEVTKEDEEDKK